MKKLPIAKVSPGDIVARPVASPTGVVLVQPGASLTAEMIRRLEGLGVETAWLEGTAPDARTPEQLQAEVSERFAGHESDDLMMALKTLVAARVAAQGGN
jgi:hypothetical protein